MIYYIYSCQAVNKLLDSVGIINGICFFDERHIPILYPFPSLFVICQLTFLTLSAIIIEIKNAIHRNDTKMDIRKITPLLIGFEEVLKCALYATE